jgi:hypothetical protein
MEQSMSYIRITIEGMGGPTLEFLAAVINRALSNYDCIVCVESNIGNRRESDDELIVAVQRRIIEGNKSDQLKQLFPNKFRPASPRIKLIVEHSPWGG